MPLLCETFAATDSLRDRGETAGEADDRLLVDLLTEQVEFADVVVVNKLDLVDETQRGQLIGLLKTFNPHAEIITAQQGQVPLGKVLGTGRFDFTRASQAAGWAQALSGHHLPESEEFGITSFVWRARRPLHPARFHAFINGDLPGIVRAKGFFWLASRMAWAGSWQLAGSIGRSEAAGHWWAANEPAHWPAEPEWRAEVQKNWQEPYGDRRQEIVFIGIGMDEATLRRDLDACLLTSAELRAGERAWARLPDPFPAWRRAEG
jgi:G3E family GTPase